MTVGDCFVLATHNLHKVSEFNTIIGERFPAINVVSYDGPEPVETGVTFAENALIKARAAATHTGLPALADDSGLCVDVMNGLPGIFSARWSGAHRDDSKNLTLLLDQLRDIPDEFRGAHYLCAIALVVPRVGDLHDDPSETLSAKEIVVEGRWSGMILREPRGTNGFGYDPIFMPQGSEVTAAQMSPEDKNAESHRARALVELVDYLARAR